MLKINLLKYQEHVVELHEWSETFIKGDGCAAAGTSFLLGHISLVCLLSLCNWVTCALENLWLFWMFGLHRLDPVTASYCFSFPSAFSDSAIQLAVLGVPAMQQLIKAEDQKTASCVKHDYVFPGLSRTRFQSVLLTGSKVI